MEDESGGVAGDGWGDDVEIEADGGDDVVGAMPSLNVIPIPIREDDATVVTEAPVEECGCGVEAAVGLDGPWAQQLRGMEERLRESEAARQRDKEEMDERMQELRQKTKDHMKQLQEKMQQVVRQKDARLEELEAANEELTSKLASGAPAEAPAAASDSESPALHAQLTELRGELATANRRAAASAAAAAAAAEGGTSEGATAAAAAEEIATLRGELEERGRQLQEAQEENVRAREQQEAKLAEVVRKAKEHVKQVQARLEVSTAENRELTEKVSELEANLATQNEKVQKYQQLMKEAKARIDGYEQREKELRESLSKSQAQRLALQEQMGSITKVFSVPPTKEQIAERGGILVAVEADNDDVWCLIRSAKEGGADDAGEGSDADRGDEQTRNGAWWLLSQLHVEDKPVPVQRRWKGEVSALRAQLQRFKRKSEDVQEEFDSYRQKANAALTSNASQVEAIQQKERLAEQLGEQLHSERAELAKARAERDRAFDDVAEARRRQQEANRETRELERTLDRRCREWEDKCESEVAACRTTLQAEKASVERAGREKERALQKELDLRRSMKDALEEEVETLRARLASRPAAAPAAVAEDEGIGLSESPGAFGLQGAGRVGAEFALPPPSSATPSGAPSPRPGSEASREAPEQQPQFPEQTPAEERPAPPAPILPAQAYSLHASVAWQDIVALRSQVRQLETSLQEERQQLGSSKKESDSVRSELREMNMQQRLQNTVGQHQQMEYIRNVFRRFVEMLPPGSKEQEALIPVLMTFFKFPDDEARLIQGNRSSGGGMLGRFGWR